VLVKAGTPRADLQVRDGDAERQTGSVSGDDVNVPAKLLAQRLRREGSTLATAGAERHEPEVGAVARTQQLVHGRQPGRLLLAPHARIAAPPRAFKREHVRAVADDLGVGDRRQDTVLGEAAEDRRRPERGVRSQLGLDEAVGQQLHRRGLEPALCGGID
jgi:hypothetical protein